MRSTSRGVTLALLSLLLLGISLRQWRGSTSAAGTDTSTWGATDPTWSPDGARIAFSLFGSIWQVRREGGIAEQVTTGEGYHAHPAWSPKGDRIAFVSGRSPIGRLPNISGKLMVVEAAGGAAREVVTEFPVAGTLAWSPDASRIACGLSVPNMGSLLHEINLATGQASRRQLPPQRAGSASWLPVAWNVKHDEIFFTAQRGGAPQVWSMPSGNVPVMIQLPLTSYRLGDIVQPHTMSATPEGDIIQSNVIVNGKGDYELYRVPRAGGKPAAITNTPRDEFAPAVSPDGKWIAHVSNHLGNIDLFLMPVAGGEKTHVPINGLKFRGSSGKARIKVLDELGRPTRARLYVRAADGKAYAPQGSAIFYYPLEAGGEREGFFIAGGDDELPAPAGELRLVALKGIEYRILERTTTVQPGQTAEITLQMERWTNWNQRGWYTGENHFHANYNGSYYQRPPESLAWLEAEDLNTANMIVANAEGAFVHDKEFFTGGVHPLSNPRYVLYWGQEYRNSDPLGHMAFLNIKKQVPPSYTSVIGSDSPYDFPLNTMAAIDARKQGGVVTYVHPSGGVTRDVFDTGLGAKEIPVTAALGAVDAIDILPFGEAAYEMWYRLLNSGIRLAPGAGTDVFTNWRGINNIPGGSRQYVEASSAMNWDRWIERYREGRVFVTNGPLISFQLNGQPMGAEIRAPAGKSYEARLSAEITSRVPLSRVEFIRNGLVIERKELGNNELTTRIESTVSVDRSSWFAVRVTGHASRGIPGGIPRAHSAPIYVLIDGRPVLVRDDVALMLRWIDRLWAYLLERDNFGPDPNRAKAREMFDEARKHFEQKLARAGT
jgi:TolB protein